jgi:hypothetical protein
VVVVVVGGDEVEMLVAVVGGIGDGGAVDLDPEVVVTVDMVR